MGRRRFAQVDLGKRAGRFYRVGVPTLPRNDRWRRPNRASKTDHTETGLSDDATPALPSLVGRFWIFLSIAVVGGGLDLWSKAAVFRWRGLPTQSDIWWVWEPYFGIETAVNIGAVFGVGAGQGTFFAGMSVVAAIGIVVWLFWFRAAESLWLTVALGMVGGGIIGNLYDRLGFWWQTGYPDQWRSGVRDWILWRINEQWTWPNFNIAGPGCCCTKVSFPGNLPPQRSAMTDKLTHRQTDPQTTTNR